VQKSKAPTPRAVRTRGEGVRVDDRSVGVDETKVTVGHACLHRVRDGFKQLATQDGCHNLFRRRNDRPGCEIDHLDIEGLRAVEQLESYAAHLIGRGRRGTGIDGTSERELHGLHDAGLQRNGCVIRGVNGTTVVSNSVVAVSVENHLRTVLVLDVGERRKGKRLCSVVTVLVAVRERHLDLEPREAQIEFVMLRAVGALDAVRALLAPQAARRCTGLAHGAFLVLATTVLANRLVEPFTDTPVHLRDLVAGVDHGLDGDEHHRAHDHDPVQPDSPGRPAVIRLWKDRRRHDAHPLRGTRIETSVVSVTLIAKTLKILFCCLFV